MVKSITIKKRLVITFIGILFANTVVMGIIDYQSEIGELRASQNDMALNQDRLFHSILASDGQGLASIHAGLSRLDTLVKPFAAKSKDELLAASQPVFRELKQSHNITHMYFIDPDGTVFLRVHKPEQFGDNLNRATFLTASETQKTATGLEMGKNFFSLRCVRPVSYQGTRIGYMEIAEEIDHVFSQMKEISGNDVSLFLTDTYLKKYAMDSITDKIGNFALLYPTNKNISVQLAEKLDSAMRKGLKEFNVSFVDVNGVHYVVGMGPIRDAFGTTAGILLSHKEVSSQYIVLWKGLFRKVALFVVVFLVSTALLFLSLRKSLALFSNLRQHILRVTKTWDLTGRLKVNSNDEIGTLANAFNEMVDALEHEHEALKDSETNFRALADNANDGMLMITGGKTFVYANQRVSQITGYSSEELLARSNEDLVHPNELANITVLYEKVLAGESVADQHETIIIHKFGTYIPVEVTCAKTVWKGEPAVLIIIRDISKRKLAEEYLKESEERYRHLSGELENRVAERTSQLDSVVAELESFCYSVSHDLRAPLTRIDGFSQMLLEDHASRLNQDGKNCLGRVRAASQRMALLLEALLKLSRLSRQEMQSVRINLSKLAAGIAKDLAAMQPERQVSFKIAEELYGMGDPHLLKVVLENLLRNAWKYTGKQEKATIEFGVTEINGTPVFFVRDDGIGFDMAYADKLFVPFQRLHAESEYEGTGIGLATVQRIINRHGGKVWAEGAVGKGATFYFSLDIPSIEHVSF